MAFANSTMQIIDSALKNAGVSRPERRQYKRRAVNTSSA